MEDSKKDMILKSNHKRNKEPVRICYRKVAKYIASTPMTWYNDVHERRYSLPSGFHPALTIIHILLSSPISFRSMQDIDMLLMMIKGRVRTEGLGEGQHIDRRGRGHCYKGPVWWSDGLVVPWLVAPLDVGCLDIGPKVQHSGRRCNSTKLSEQKWWFQQLSQTTTRCQTKRPKLLCRPHLLN